MDTPIIVVGFTNDYALSKVDTTVCSAAFMLYCTHSKKRCKCLQWEKSSGAANYRGELLSGLMVQLVHRAASQNIASPYAPVKIDCNNIGVVKHGNNATQQLKEKQPQVDVLRCLKQHGCF